MIASVGSLGFTKQVAEDPTGWLATNFRVPDSDRIPQPPMVEDLCSSPFHGYR